MTNTVALILALLIAIGVTVDFTVFDKEGSVFLVRKTIELLDWLAFWR